MKPFQFLLATGLLLASASPAALAASLSAEDFAHKAAISNRFEVESSRLALEKSRQADLRTFAQQMIRDHTAAGDRLKSVVEGSNLGIELPEQLDTEHQKMLDQLAASTSFDNDYLSMQAKAHQDAVTLFQSYASEGDAPTLRAFASETLPTLHSHADSVASIKAP